MAERDLVELVTDAGVGDGETTVGQAHRAPGLLHRAFSVVAHDGSGSVLLQRRAEVKLRFPGVWANACCGHVAPGVGVEEAAARRFREELGFDCGPLTRAGVHVYTATDPTSRMVEREYDHVLLARVDQGTVIDADPEEIDEIRWVTVEAWRHRVGADHAPWLAGVLDVAAGAMSR